MELSGTPLSTGCSCEEFIQKHSKLSLTEKIWNYIKYPSNWSRRTEIIQEIRKNSAFIEVITGRFTPVSKENVIADLPFLWDALNSISNLPKVMRAKFQGSDRLFCFISISKIGNFKNPFAMITSLPQLLFGSSRFILLVWTKEVISVSYSSSTNLRTCCCRRVEVAWGGVAYGQGDVWCKTGW